MQRIAKCQTHFASEAGGAERRPFVFQDQVTNIYLPAMPIVRISAPDHLSINKLKALGNAVHEALIATCNVRTNDRFLLITRFGAEAMMIDPTFPHFERTPDASIVEISFLRGRSAEQKRNLYKQIAQNALLSGIVPDDIMIVLTEKSPIDCSFGRGETISATP